MTGFPSPRARIRTNLSCGSASPFSREFGPPRTNEQGIDNINGWVDLGARGAVVVITAWACLGSWDRDLMLFSFDGSEPFTMCRAFDACCVVHFVFVVMTVWVEHAIHQSNHARASDIDPESVIGLCCCIAYASRSKSPSLSRSDYFTAYASPPCRTSYKFEGQTYLFHLPTDTLCKCIIPTVLHQTLYMIQ